MESPVSLVSGFDATEAETLLKICQKVYANSPKPPTQFTAVPTVPNPPDHWQIRSDLSPTTVTLDDSYWQVWQNTTQTHQYAIAVRGPVNAGSSDFTDFLLPMIKARFSIPLPQNDSFETLDFNLARDEVGSTIEAGVHAGFALSLMLMLGSTDCPLMFSLGRLAALNFASNDRLQLFVSGHGQGASVALLLTSFIRHSALFSGIRTKTYAFGPAKPGNDHYANDLDQIAGAKGMCFSVCNSQDWVPQVPLTLQNLENVNTPNSFFGYPYASVADAPQAVVQMHDSVNRAASQARQRLNDLLRQHADRLETESLTISNADYDPVEIESGFVNALKTIESNILPSLNYTTAGCVAPLFGEPSSNPEDPGDAYWQHHLGNYRKYLQAQPKVD
jgi:hypothetical protein